MSSFPEDRIAAAGRKPLGVKTYGSIGHIPGSRLGPKDYSLHDKQAVICTDKDWRSRSGRPKRVYVQTKIDGSCVGAARLPRRDGTGDEIVALTRAGLLARQSRFNLHRMWASYVDVRQDDFRAILRPGERAVGEWLAMAVSTLYDLKSPATCNLTETETIRLDSRPPFVLFDIISRPTEGDGNQRVTMGELRDRILSARGRAVFVHPHTLEGPMGPEEAMGLLDHYGAQQAPGQSHRGEGVIYRVEDPAIDAVNFLAKWVREDKEDGSLLDSDVWNWGWAELKAEAARRAAG